MADDEGLDQSPVFGSQLAFLTAPHHAEDLVGLDANIKFDHPSVRLIHGDRARPFHLHSII